MTQREELRYMPAPNVSSILILNPTFSHLVDLSYFCCYQKNNLLNGFIFLLEIRPGSRFESIKCFLGFLRYENDPKKTDSANLSNIISNSPGTSLELITKMTLVNDRIDLKSARSIFDRLRTSLKIKLPVDLLNSIDGIIINNTTAFLNNYAHDLSAIR